MSRKEGETSSAKITLVFALLIGILIFLTMGIAVGEAAASHNNALAELVFSAQELPETTPDALRKQILWMREEVKQLEGLTEAEEKAAEETSLGKPDLLRMQAYFYVLFFGDVSECVPLESFYACFAAEDVKKVEQNLARLLNRPVSEAESANAGELYHRLQYGFSLPASGDVFDDWVNQLPGNTSLLSGTDGICCPIGANWRSVVSSEFGMRKDPVTGERKGHGGIDLAVPTGTEVCCAWDGAVQAVRCSKTGYGYHVIVSHENGLVTLYAHCSKLLVKEGQQIKAGTVIALSGSTGKSTGPHLHFEVRVNGEQQNPRKYLP